MEKLKSTFTNMALALTLVAVFAGGLLAWVNHITQGPIKAQEEKTLTDAIGLVMADGSLKVSSTYPVRINHDGDISTYIVHNATDSKGTPLGCAVESVVMGFGGNMKVLVGFDTKGTILGYQVLQTSETPGLGQKAGQWFQKDAKGCIVGREMSETKPLAVKNDGGDVDAITASTITSRAFLKAVNRAFEAYRKNSAENAPAVDSTTGASPKHKHHK